MKKSFFVETVRLLMVLVCMIAGYGLGTQYEAVLYGSLLGASIGYVAGGILGRFLRRTTALFEESTAHYSAGELLSGIVGSLLAGALAGLVAVPAVFLLPDPWGWPLFSLIVWVGVHMGFQILCKRSAALLSLAGLSEEAQDGDRRAETRDAVLVDTSVLIDGRLLRLAQTGFLHRHLLVPAFVLDELRGFAESQDAAQRRKARSGLESLEVIRRDALLQVEVPGDEVPELDDVDAKLVSLATRLAVPLLTNDEALARVAEIRGVRCLNLHRLAKSLSSVLTPGERVNLSIVKQGQRPGEGVGFLEEGSMVVVSDASDRVGQEADVCITTSVRSPVGRIFFATLASS